MKRKTIQLAMAALLLVGVYLLSREAARVTMLEKNSTVVVIDAGHGGTDPGKVGVNGTLEKDINLSIARLVEEKLKEHQVEVIMTRETDELLGTSNGESQKAADLRERCRIINEAKPVCAVSIHQNSYTEESVNGAQVFYYETSEESLLLATVLQQALVDGLNPDNHRQSKGNTTYYILKKTEVPTVIAECGFLSNTQEEALLNTQDYQEKVAEAITQGIMDYIGQKQGKNGT